MRGDAAITLAGLAVMSATFGLLWLYLPTDSKTAPSVAATSAPHVIVAICVAFALAFAMILAGFLDYFGAR